MTSMKYKSDLIDNNLHSIDNNLELLRIKANLRAKMLLNEGFPLEYISKRTGVPIEKILKMNAT